MPTPLELLRTRFRLEAFRPGQEAVVTRLLAGRSVLAVFPTGGGKSLCYQLPALALEGLTLVVSPLFALMKDQVDALRRLGIEAARLDSSLSLAETRAVQESVARGETKLLYVAPERLSNERFVARLRGKRIALLAIDEAHCISEWGHNFRPEYLKLARAAKELRAERVLALTATATPAVAKDVCRAFAIAPEDHVQTGFDRPNLELAVTPCEDRERAGLLLERLRGFPGPAIAYVTLQKQAEEHAERLARGGVAALAYHAGLEPEERTRVQEAFMRGETRVVVATIAFGMGIDKSDIRAVYHVNLPKTLENYAQETGRAGRDGLPSRCEVLACADDQTTLESFTLGDTPTRESLAALVRELLGGGASADRAFSVSTTDLSFRHDIRPLVVATALTYLELEGAIRETGPFYTEYKLKPLRDEAVIVARFDARRRAFLEAVFGAAKRGRAWLTLDLDATAESLREPRDRIVKAIGYLEDEGDLEVQPSGLRLGFLRLGAESREAELVARLVALFEKREARDLERGVGVLRFLEDPGCLARHLLGYFGEERVPCGRCTSCRDPRPRRLPRTPPRAPTPDEEATARALALEGHAALRHPRALARFLAGLSSPAASRARLGRDPRFGLLAAVPFAEILALAVRLRS